MLSDFFLEWYPEKMRTAFSGTPKCGATSCRTRSLAALSSGSSRTDMSNTPGADSANDSFRAPGLTRTRHVLRMMLLPLVLADEFCLFNDVALHRVQHFSFRGADLERKFRVERIEREHVAVFRRLVLRRRALCIVCVLSPTLGARRSGASSFWNFGRCGRDVEEHPMVKNTVGLQSFRHIGVVHDERKRLGTLRHAGNEKCRASLFPIASELRRNVCAFCKCGAGNLEFGRHRIASINCKVLIGIVIRNEDMIKRVPNASEKDDEPDAYQRERVAHVGNYSTVGYTAAHSGVTQR